ncbi:MAG TPA: glycosyltransferase family 87 protein [Vicinamibacterales bacterium]|nr:glycosyltransferase family 87 protein [Vicinamibacterales bacterium]
MNERQASDSMSGGHGGDAIAPPRRSYRGRVILALIVVATALLPTAVRKMPDFEVSWRAGRRILLAESLYRTTDQHFQEKYFPVFGMAMVPLALLPLRVAKITWYYASIAAIAGLVAMSISLLPHRKRPPAVLAFIGTVAMLKFFAHEVNLGQCNALMVLLVLVGFQFLMRDRPGVAGASFALSAVVKPYAIIVLPYLFARRSLLAFGTMLTAIVAILLVPAAIYGMSGNFGQLEGWARTVLNSSPPNLLNQDNVSIWAMYSKWFGAGAVSVDLAFGTIAAIVVTFLGLIRTGADLPHPEYLEMAVLLALVPLFSPQGWDYVLLAATPAVVLLANELSGLPPSIRWTAGGAVAVMAFSVFDLMGRRAYAAFMSASAITVCAIVLLASMAYMRIYRIA